ncbi:TonB-dependent receptor domain-containing protein [Brevundimonas sp. SL130]|uniref:TonB-dependent receptor domain-containing protein n=1 Tax=Brevundimonas sp. SL130 TaxID=2995143 RepID=UPI00226C7C25|nr:TonB-dependent receptor [Brevundimonas sp. SL130]WAC59369.1 TonB-dependent receptor [Brevundimonas sp. SL130]
MLQSKSQLLGSTMVAGFVAVAMIATASSAAAQSTTTGAQTSAQSTEPTTKAESARVEDIVVTGSRIRRNEFSSAQPMNIITSEQTDLRGVPDAATALLSSVLAASSFQLNDQLTGYVTAGGGGTQSLSLRGLGAQRTLVLLNGRRLGPAGTRGQVQAVDLSIIPQSQVERIDILKDGASSIYGSDAVAGVVNIITKRNMDGGSISAYASQPFEGGGEQYRLDAAYGQTMDRGYWSGSVNYLRTEILRRSDRDDTSCAADYLFDPETQERLDYIDPRTGSYKCFNLTNGYVQTTSGLNLVPLTRYGSAYNYAVAGNNSPYAGWARFNRAGYPGTYLYAPTDSALWSKSSVISPSESLTLNFSGGYDLTPSAELYGEFLYNRRTSHQNGVAQVFQSFAQRNIINGAPNYLPASNPNNLLGTNAVTVGVYESSSNQEVDYYRGVAGVRGSFGALDRQWDYDVYGQYSYSDAVYDNGPRILLDRFVALNSPNVACTNTPLGGNVSNFNCADLPAGIPWMSDRVLAGNFTQAERDFLFVTEEGTTTYEHGYVEGTLATDRLFSLPAGDVGAAFGFQVRHEAIDDTPPYWAANRNIALYTSAARTAGDDNVREIFAEFEVPLLKALPFVEALDFNVSGRLSDYDSYGTSDTYKTSLNWQISPEYRLRASYGTSFRAPALYELYLGSQIGYSSQSATDPCYNYGDSGVDTTIQSACSALGIPDDYTAVGGSSVPVATIGGEGRLEAETGKSTNFGFIWTPSFADLNVAIDYWELEINNQVSTFGGYNIIEQCLRGNTDFCGLYTRDATTHYVTGVDNSYINVAKQTNRGIDFSFSYSREMPFGDLTISSQHTWKLEDFTSLLGGVTENYLGTTFNYNGPAYTGNMYFTLRKGDWTWFYGIDAIGRGSDISEAGGQVFANSRYADLANGISSADCSAANNYCAYYKYYTEFTTVHSASMRYNVNDWTFQVGVNNLYDERPPAVNTGEFRVGTAALNGYDMRGRRGYVRISKTF